MATLHPRTTTELFGALDVAAKTPGTVIQLVKGRKYSLDRDLILRGINPIFDVNEAVLDVANNYDASPVAKGLGILVIPELGPEVAFARQPDSLWCCPHGYAATLCSQLGGTQQPYQEAAPVQVATSDPPLFAYTLARQILTPAIGGRILNARIHFSNPQAAGAISLINTHGWWVENVQVMNETQTNGKGSIAVTGSQRTVITHCIAPTIELNSSTSCRVNRCQSPRITMEEVCRWCDIDNNLGTHIKILDITCQANRILYNVLKGQGLGGSICLPGGKRTEVVGNICEDFMWICPDAQGSKFFYNSAPRLDDNYAGPVDYEAAGNSWQGK